jgi:hypothetical protein
MKISSLVLIAIIAKAKKSEGFSYFVLNFVKSEKTDIFQK